MVEAEGGKIIIDTTGTIETGREVRSIFDRLNPYPIKAVIYTHNHGDHVFGARAFVDNEEIQVIAHETTEDYINRILGILRPIINKRSSRMFGSALPTESIENNGIGPFLEIGKEGRQTSLVYPTTKFDEFLELNIDNRKTDKENKEAELLTMENDLRKEIGLNTFESYQALLDREELKEEPDIDEEILLEAANILSDFIEFSYKPVLSCLLYTYDAAEEDDSVDL